MYDAQDTWQPQPEQRAPRTNRRRFVRIGTDLRGYIARNFRLAECEILDVSLGGARIRSKEKLADQTHLTLGFGRFGTITGEVVWRRKGVMGLKYADTPRVVQQTMSRFLPELCMAG